MHLIYAMLLYHNHLPIINAARGGNAEIVNLFLSDPRVDPFDNDYQAILEAARWKNVAIVKLLLADPRLKPSARWQFKKLLT
jgi:hypothetical protein